MKKRACVAVMLMAGLVLFGFGCQKKGGDAPSADTPASGYSVVNYKNVMLYPGGSGSLSVTVNGPAADLAVVLVTPNGEPSFRTIDKKDMIANCQTVVLDMSERDLYQKGEWTLMLKSVSPEKVIWKRKINFYNAVHPQETAKNSG